MSSAPTPEAKPCAIIDFAFSVQARLLFSLRFPLFNPVFSSSFVRNTRDVLVRHDRAGITRARSPVFGSRAFHTSEARDAANGVTDRCCHRADCVALTDADVVARAVCDEVTCISQLMSNFPHQSLETVHVLRDQLAQELVENPGKIGFCIWYSNTHTSTWVLISSCSNSTIRVFMHPDTARLRLI